MSNECQRAIMLHAPMEICIILQIEEILLINLQTLTCTGKGMVAIRFLPESQYLGKYR